MDYQVLNIAHSRCICSCADDLLFPKHYSIFFLCSQAAEAHEAQVVAELRAMEDIAAERDQLAAQVWHYELMLCCVTVLADEAQVVVELRAMEDIAAERDQLAAEVV